MKYPLLFFLISYLFVYAQSVNSQISSVTIPQNRLLTDSEFIELVKQSQCCENIIKESNENSLKAIAQYFKNRAKPQYFWGSDNIKSRITEFVNIYPIQAKNITEQADLFIATYGADLEWKIPGEDLLGRKHTPNTIRYLARQAHAVDIAMTHHIEEDPKYIAFLKKQILDFVKDYQAGNTQQGKNDVFERFYAGHRLRNWLFMYNILKESSFLEWQDHILMLKIFFLHGARLYEVCKKFNWGNHQLHGLAGLYEMTLMYPEFARMRFWNKSAKKVILEHIEKEIKEDGFQFERASHYFKFDVINYFRIYQLSKINSVDLGSLYNERFSKMFESIINLLMPNQKLPILQDAQDSYEKNSNDAAELADPTEAELLSLAALLYNEGNFKYFGETKFPAVFNLFFEESQVNNYAQIKPQIPSAKSVALDSSKYFVMRAGKEDRGLYVIIDGGLAKYKPDHTHGGVLGIIMHAYGEELLPNYRVQYSNPSYRTLKNSLVKNVALADGILQGQNWISNTSRTGFGIWKDLPQPHVIDWFSGDRFDFFKASHNGFEKVHVDYKRSVLFVKPHFWLVLDDFKSKDLHSYQQIWQGEYEIDTQYNRLHFKGQQAQLTIIQADPGYMKIAERDNFAKKSVQFEKTGVSDYSFLTVLYPDSVNSSVKPDIRLFERNDYKQIQIKAADHEYSYYFNKGKILKLDELISDAGNICLSYKADSLHTILVQYGSSLKMQGIEMSAEKPCVIELTKMAGEWKPLYLKGPQQSIVLNNKKYLLSEFKE